ncbi:MAG: DUF480 domain-containing protein [Gammaproteobacteria bacterium]|nr:DUF480 domain-containing protein [Gammaproteobacteria bacterium]
MPELLLTPAEARVLAALVEKSIITPQYYPMTVNAIAQSASQKTARKPVMRLGQGEAGAALNALATLGLVSRDDRAGRVPKWRHHAQHQLLLPSAELALLVTLMLRGPQTVAELRGAAAALGGPADADTVAQGLERLADRAQPLVAALPRQPGQSALRHAHTLCGEPPAAAAEALSSTPGGGELAQRLTRLEARVAELEARLRGCAAEPIF